MTTYRSKVHYIEVVLFEINGIKISRIRSLLVSLKILSAKNCSIAIRWLVRFLRIVIKRLEMQKHSCNRKLGYQLTICDFCVVQFMVHFGRKVAHLGTMWCNLGRISMTAIKRIEGGHTYATIARNTWHLVTNTLYTHGVPSMYMEYYTLYSIQYILVYIVCTISIYSEGIMLLSEILFTIQKLLRVALHFHTNANTLYQTFAAVHYRIEFEIAKSTKAFLGRNNLEN